MAEGDAVCYDCDRKRCSQRDKLKGRKDYDARSSDLPHGSLQLICRECMVGKRTRGMWTCRNKACRQQKPIAEFSMAIERQGPKVAGDSRRCNACVQKHDDEMREQNRRSAQLVQKRDR